MPRVLASLMLMAAVLTLGNASANAESTLVSILEFSPDDPTYDPHGSGTEIIGDVEITSEGWLDFQGRSVVKTPNRPALNPGTADFSFGSRIALTRGVGEWNIMQKGFWSDGQWKISTHAKSGGAQFSCRVNGSEGAVRAITDGPVLSPDGTWHEVLCARIGSEIRIQIDGTTVATATGSIGSVVSDRPYLIGSKGAGDLVDPDQYLGLLDDAFVMVGSPDPGNLPPIADFGFSCSELTCSFDGTSSRDPEGQDLSYSWDFGDSQTASSAAVTHTYDQPGEYVVQLEVRDPEGATAATSRPVEASGTEPGEVAFRGSEGGAANTRAMTIAIPGQTQPGDRLLLAVAANRSDVSLVPPSGWQALGVEVDGSMQSALWQRVAQPGDAGAAVSVTSSTTTKMAGHVLAYGGPDAVAPDVVALSASESGRTVSHRTPTVNAAAGSWVVSWWADKTASSTGWAPPAGVVPRDERINTGKGRIASLVADSGAPIDGSVAGGLVADGGAVTNKATMWTVVLTP